MINWLLTRIAEVHESPRAKHLPRKDAGAWGIPIVAAACLVVSHYEGNPSFWRKHFGAWMDAHPGIGPIGDYLGWFAASVGLYFVVPMLALLFLREPLAEFGLGFGRWRRGVAITGILVGVMIPVVALVARTPAFAAQYPLSKHAADNWRLFLIYELGYAAYFIVWEHLFRSFLLFGLERRIGWHAIWAQMLPFALIHLGKPEAEALGSIAAGIALGYLALITRSFWWGAAVHIIVAVGMDLAASWGRLGR